MTDDVAVTLAPRHRAPGPPAGSVADLSGDWHIGITHPGLFPLHEMSCPCPKSKCGLVIPSPEIPCDLHHGTRTILQFHTASQCRPPRQGRWSIKRRW